MSPLEAKQYGIIDHVIGGDEAGFQVKVQCFPFPVVDASWKFVAGGWRPVL